MKAETVRKFMLKKYPTKYYFDCPVPQHHWPVIQEYADEYARAQIMQDRKRIVEAYYGCSDHNTFNDLIKGTPIELD